MKLYSRMYFKVIFVLEMSDPLLTSAVALLEQFKQMERIQLFSLYRLWRFSNECWAIFAYKSLSWKSLLSWHSSNVVHCLSFRSFFKLIFLNELLLCFRGCLINLFYSGSYQSDIKMSFASCFGNIWKSFAT